MIDCNSLPTLLPNAVLRCYKIQAATDVQLDDMQRLTLHQMNKLYWQEQRFKRILNERHEKWRVSDQAFRLKLQKELNTNLVVQRKDQIKKRRDSPSEFETPVVANYVIRSSSAHPRSNRVNVSINKGSQSAVDTQRRITKVNQPISIVNEARKLSLRTSRSDLDYNAVLFRILSNTVYPSDHSSKRSSVFKPPDHHLTCTTDDRYLNLLQQLVPCENSTNH